SANTSNSWFRNRLIDKLDNNSSVPTGHFHHYYGVHTPYSFNAEGKPLPAQERSTESGLQATCEWELCCFVDFLNELKMRDMYDGATIVLVGDHGDGRLKIEANDISFTSADTPLLLVKPQNTRQSFEYSNAPTSNAFLPKLVRKAHEGRQVFVNFLSGLPNERKIFRQPDQLFAVLGTDLDTLLFNKLDIDVKLKPTILRLGQEYTFNRTSTNLPLAVPIQAQKFRLSGGMGMDFTDFKEAGLLEIAVDHAPGKIDIFLSSHFGQYRDLHTAALVSLTITDLFSEEILYNKEEKLPINQNWDELDSILKNVTIKDKKIRLAFKSNSPNNCVYVLRGIKISEIEDLKPTILKLGQEYTFNRTADNNLPLVVPIQAQNFRLDGGMGMDFSNFKEAGLLEIAVDHAPGKFDILLSNLFQQYRDLNTAAFVSLTITDLFSGEILYHKEKEEELPTNQNWVALDSILKNVTIKDKKIRLAFKSNSPDNCWYALKGIKISEIEDLKPTILKLGQEYTFNRTADNNLPLVVPIQAKNFRLDGGMGMDFSNFKEAGLLEIAVDHAPGKIDIFLSNLFQQNSDLHKFNLLSLFHSSAALVSLTITDLFSGEILYNKEEKLPINQNWVVLDSILKNVTIKDKKIRLAFKSNSPDNCWYALKGIKIGRDEK
ncbi:MAG: hypothetical protein FWH53_06865, partial [Leptospirales bacterium]|nr:hypothetical protein [Leptospirales bacterium]